MNYSELVDVYSVLDSKSGRLEMTDIVADFLKNVPESELSRIVLMLTGRVFPLWSEKELGIGEKLVVKAISTISGVTEEKVEDKIRETGDSGKAAEQLIGKKAQTTLSSDTLTVKKVYDNLDRLAGLTGKGSQDKKISYISELLSSASGLEARYIVRTILEELRLGVGEGILRDAVAKAYEADKALVERAYVLRSDFGEVALTAKKKGNAGLEAIGLEPGHPMQVMLAQKIGGVKEALEELGSAAFEIKYDGARLQIHKKGSSVKLFTRRLENVTKQFPEVASEAKKKISADSAIVEGEMVAIKGKGDRTPLPFQDLSRRLKRKYDIEEMVEKIPVEVNLFDVTYCEGETMLETPFSERRKKLSSIIDTTASFRLADELVTSDVEEAEKFYQKALSTGHEGVMAKNLESVYKPGSRVGYMYKIKPVMETLDLVIVGATWGEGRRANWLGSYLLAALDEATGDYLTIGRMATGFSDEELEEMTSALKGDILEQTGKEVRIRPRVVVEVAYEEIQKSPTYESGYALRFPRLVRVRTDKGARDADTLERVSEILKSS